jgi:hypothetical protein
MKDDPHTALNPGAEKTHCALWMDAFVFSFLGITKMVWGFD